MEPQPIGPHALFEYADPELQLLSSGQIVLAYRN